MRVQNSDNQPFITAKPKDSNTSRTMDFANVLKNQSLSSQKIDTLASARLDHPAPSITDSKTKTIHLGTLSDKNSTVAQLLLNNKNLKSKTWSIIHDPINKTKTFQQIPLGSQIVYNQDSRELNWTSHKQALISNTRKSAPLKPIDIPTISEQKASLTDSNKIVLGIIDQSSPTVSNLLFQHNDLKYQRWNIIHSEVNKHKPFTQIPSGTTIYFDSQSKELSWSAPTPAVRSDQHPHRVAQRLDDAVKPFMGTDYKELDCYTLVVHGLEKMGVRYKGQDSLSRELLHMAQTEGRAENAYFTGEGITEAMGEKIYTRSITQVNDIRQQSQAIYQEMQHLMKKGDILSFSLKTRGHTGVVSHNQEQWTYINSGRLDNSINPGAPKNGVGEETLLDEISNWIKRARKSKESLEITVGRLDHQKFA